MPLLLQQKQELLVKAYQIQPPIQRQLRPKQELRPPQAKEQRQQQEPTVRLLGLLCQQRQLEFQVDFGSSDRSQLQTQAQAQAQTQIQSRAQAQAQAQTQIQSRASRLEVPEPC